MVVWLWEGEKHYFLEIFISKKKVHLQESKKIQERSRRNKKMILMSTPVDEKLDNYLIVSTEWNINWYTQVNQVMGKWYGNVEEHWSIDGGLSQLLIVLVKIGGWLTKSNKVLHIYNNWFGLSGYKVRLGEHTINTNPDCLDNVCMDKVQDIPVKNVIYKIQYWSLM